MKIYISIVSLILLISTCVKKAEYPWFTGSFDDAKANAGDKLIMLDFYAAW